MTPPASLPELPKEVLRRLSACPEATEIVLGGYLALQHHVDYRSTNDIDAWWLERESPPAVGAIRSVMREVAAAGQCSLREKRFGETMSWELVREGKKSFSFQIAVRSATLEKPVPSAWPPILIESFTDTVGSKMNALVDRGAPRDFLDIRAVSERRLITADRCWQLWLRKNPSLTVSDGKKKVRMHLCALDARRPLSTISDRGERDRAERTRRWFLEEFVADA